MAVLLAVKNLTIIPFTILWWVGIVRECYQASSVKV